MKLIIVAVFATLLLEVYSDSGLKMLDVIHFKSLSLSEKCEPHKALLKKGVCEYDDDDWLQIKECVNDYATTTGEINVETGYFDFEKIKKFRSPKDMNLMMASLCDVKYDNQPGLDSTADKILYAYKKSVKRVARCEGIKNLTCEESCRRGFATDAEFNSNNPCNKI